MLSIPFTTEQTDVFDPELDMDLMAALEQSWTTAERDRVLAQARARFRARRREIRKIERNQARGQRGNSRLRSTFAVRFSAATGGER